MTKRILKSDFVSMIIIEDDNEEEYKDNEKNEDKPLIQEEVQEQVIEEVLEEVFEITPAIKRKSKKVIEQPVEKKNRNVREPLKTMFEPDTNIIEIGIDEAGRGPMFGRVYAGVVVLPKDNVFEHSEMKDSKKFHSKTKIENVAEYIKQNAIAWAVEYEDEQTIDEINILQATQSAMHKGIKSVLNQLPNINLDKILLLVDGNYFKPLTVLNNTKTKLETIKYHTIEGGDNKYTSIAAASILAKVERDKYIEDLCLKNPELIEHYSIDSNKGYGAKVHMDGIKKYGITKWHRKTFGICKNYC
jgi:ribonuclease HII